MEPASLKLVGYESDPGNISRSLIRHEMKMTKHLWSYMEAILADMNTSWETVKIRPKKNFGSHEIWTRTVSQRSCVQIPYEPEFFGPY